MPPDLAQIYDAHAAALHAYALSLTRCQAEARDVLQDVFTTLARQGERWSAVESPRAWLLCLTRRAVSARVRRAVVAERAAEKLSADPWFELPADADAPQFARALTDAMRSLPAEQREVVHLKLWEALSFQQIADLLGISPNTAASRHRYGLTKLRTVLQPLWEEIRHLPQP